MKLYLLPSSKFLDFFSHLAKDGSVFYPVLEDEKAHIVRFDTDKASEPNFTKIRTAENIKHFFFLLREENRRKIWKLLINRKEKGLMEKEKEILENSAAQDELKKLDNLEDTLEDEDLKKLD